MCSPLLPSWIVAAALTCGAPGMDQEIRESIETFLAIYRKSQGDPALRVAAIRDLFIELDYARKPRPEGFGYSPHQMAEAELAAAKALDDALGDPNFHVRAAVVDVLRRVQSPEVGRHLLETVLANKRERSGERKATAAAALGRMGYRGAVPVLMAALGDPDFTLVHAAIDALGELRAREAVPPLLERLASAAPPLQTAIIDGLALIDDRETAVPRILEHIETGPWQVRSAAIQALGVLRHPDSVEPLVELYVKEEGRLREEIYQALQKLTGYDYGPYPDRWLEWWQRSRDGFQFPSDAEMTRRKSESVDSARRYAEMPKASTFAGVPTASQRIVFVIDTSGSMEDLISNRETFLLKDRSYKSLEKMEVVKEELTRTVEQLAANVSFNIIAFATKVEKWKRQLVPATLLNKQQAADFVKRLEPIEGASMTFKGAARRLPGGAGLGKTNTYDALMTALGGEQGEDYDQSASVPIDTIFFLSDGQPTTGKYVDPVDIRAEVRRVNKLRKIVIHTIAIGIFEKSFMKMLAHENGGRFVDLTPAPQ
ncbi:MAG: HEAT repeat domain-containing protein [Planctomycetota bacterium]